MRCFSVLSCNSYAHLPTLSVLKKGSEMNGEVKSNFVPFLRQDIKSPLLKINKEEINDIACHELGQYHVKELHGRIVFFFNNFMFIEKCAPI